MQENGLDVNIPNGIIYVDLNATGNNDGTSWENAYIDLQSALEDNPINREIWVARGTYFPTTDGDRERSFAIPDRVKVYGGFVGNETSLGQRDWLSNPTILSGNIGDPNRADDNTARVVDIGDTSAFVTVLDGFRIVEGNSIGSSFRHGAGIYGFQNSNAELTNLIIANNSSAGDGGGINVLNGSDLNVNNVALINNSAENNGGAIYASSSSGTIVNSLFVGNVSDSGGAIYILEGNNNNGVYNLANNTFYNNRADTGGVLSSSRFFGVSSVEITNSIFDRNSSANDIFVFESQSGSRWF